MLRLFLFHIDYTIYAYHVLFLKKTTTLFTKRYRTHFKIYSDLDTFDSDSIFVFTWGKSNAVMY